MKRFFVLLFLLSIILPKNSFAQGLRTLDLPNQEDYELVAVPSDKVVDDDYFAAGGMVEISGTVNGDVYVAGGQVTIDGNIDGDVLGIGGTILISGNVSRDVRIIGGSTTITGTVDGNVTAAGGSITLTDSAKLNGNLSVVGGNILVHAPVAGSLRSAAGNLTVHSAIGKDIESAAGKIRLSSTASVGGNILYWGDENIVVDNGADISGEIEKREIKNPQINREQAQIVTGGVNLFSTALSLITTLTIGVLLIHFYPKFNVLAIETINSKALSSVGLGFVALIIIPIAAFMLFLSILGIPLGLILFVLYFLTAYISRIYVMSWIGSKIVKNTTSSPLLIFVVGMVVYYIVGIIPIIGGLAKFITVIVGFGALLITKKGCYLKIKDKQLV